MIKEIKYRLDFKLSCPLLLNHALKLFAGMEARIALTQSGPQKEGTALSYSWDYNQTRFLIRSLEIRQREFFPTGKAPVPITLCLHTAQTQTQQRNEN